MFDESEYLKNFNNFLTNGRFNGTQQFVFLKSLLYLTGNINGAPYKWEEDLVVCVGEKLEVDLKKFVDKKAGISIKYPSDWEIEKNLNGAVAIFYSPLTNELDFFRDNVNVIVRDASNDPRGLANYSIRLPRIASIQTARSSEH